MQVISCTEEHKDRLTEIWLLSVSRSLSDADPGQLGFYTRMFKEEILERFEIWAVRARFGGDLTGFIAMNGPKVELLVVHPHYQGQGIARLLLDHAGQRGELAVDVGEQNAGAYDFYQRYGFVETGRSDLDVHGQPSPTLHLLRPQLEPQTGAS
ncbi:GNAT family N-acetyltransferase [Saccharibacillus sp. CPCC 101409]|uniref:GNAT family N-acetyltransferase n=1 Tax=Saccharibacillus sp. CPCC 101409 TaxID=3058041 RepID=UPI002671C9FA|nr:GNAT family N-acetyltransferase [Saccharibacillus sp. CPCC 101409]MDO3410823.1 GNAT family N-acetyltransferase [Saccharibacillus sp. CPCC 101409]